MELIKHFPNLRFASSSVFKWSPTRQVVMFDPEELETPGGQLSLLHEIGHAQLEHKSYIYDIELLRYELLAWERAIELSDSFGISINDEHIEQCLEGYRNWMYKRSRCPHCNEAGAQQSPVQYHCFVCKTRWAVSRTRSLHPKRMKID